MINIFKKTSDNRDNNTNMTICILVILSILIIPSYINYYVSRLISDSILSSIVSGVIYIALLVLVYYKDLVNEFKSTKKNIKKDLKKSFKKYIFGFIAMICFNYIISVILKSTSDNETAVRGILYSSPILYMINISIIAPIEEEIVFRHSLKTVISDKYTYALVSGLLFGFAHLNINFASDTFVTSDLLYLLPYTSLGIAFALMVYDTKSTFTSIIYHSIHNTVIALLLIILYFSGV